LDKVKDKSDAKKRAGGVVRRKKKQREKKKSNELQKSKESRACHHFVVGISSSLLRAYGKKGGSGKRKGEGG